MIRYYYNEKDLKEGITDLNNKGFSVVNMFNSYSADETGIRFTMVEFSKNDNKESKNYYTLEQCDLEMCDRLESVECDSNMVDLGFICYGHLKECKGYENFYERLFVWVFLKDDNKVNIVVTLDTGNSWCHVAYMDMYVEDILKNKIEV